MSELRLAGLKVHLNDSALSKPGEMTAAVVLLHGFGAPGTDLVALGDVLDVPKGTAIFFPEGPIDLGVEIGSEYSGARAWWPIDMVQLQVAMMTGHFQKAAKGLAVGIEVARPQVLALLQELQSRFGLASDRIVLGGFSQGAVACLDVTLSVQHRFAGLLLMSGTTVSPESIEELARQKIGMRALVSHGRSDPMLPFGLAEALRDQLRAAEWEVTWVPFAGGHGIPIDVLKAVSTLLPKWLQ
jgi:phospholipase/carboxylesterase